MTTAHGPERNDAATGVRAKRVPQARNARANIETGRTGAIEAIAAIIGIAETEVMARATGNTGANGVSAITATTGANGANGVSATTGEAVTTATTVNGANTGANETPAILRKDKNARGMRKLPAARAQAGPRALL